MSKGFNKYYTLIFNLPKGELHASTCRVCIYYNTSDTNAQGWAWCTRLGGYRRPNDYCGYNPN